MRNTLLRRQTFRLNLQNVESEEPRTLKPLDAGLQHVEARLQDLAAPRPRT